MNIPVWNEWKLVELIGEGAFSKVYRAERQSDGTCDTAAIKIISVPSEDRQLTALAYDGLSQQETEDFLYSLVKSYTSEIKLMTSFRSCPNVVSILDHTICKKTSGIGWDIFIRTELLTPLDKYISTVRPDEAMIVRLGTDICSALSAFSSASPKIVHRDIKPTNIFVSDFGTFKLGDLGSAREILSSCENYTRLANGEFTPPEAANSNEYTALSDIYALGLVMYKLANKNLLPFVTSASDVKSRREAYEMRFSGREIPLPCGVSTELGKVICKACAFRPEDRFRSAGEFSQALSSLHDSRRAAPRAPVGVFISAAVAAAAAGVIVLGMLQRPALPVAEPAAAVSEETDSSIPADVSVIPEPTESTPQTSGTTATAPVEAATAPESAGTSPEGSSPQPESTSPETTAIPPEETTAAVRTGSSTTTAPRSTAPSSAQTPAATSRVTTPTTAASTAAPESAAQPQENAAEYTPASAFRYSISAGSATITEYIGSDPDVAVPPVIDGAPVTEIGRDAFSETAIRSVKIPEGVSTIDDRAFFFCKALNSIVLPDSLQVIGGNTFYGCTALSELYIPGNVVSIGGLSFGWSGLSSITVAAGNQYFSSADGVLYNRKMTTLLFYPPEKPEQEFTLPDTVTEIGFYAIDRPVNLRKLTLNGALREFSSGRVTGSISEFSAQDSAYFRDIDGVLFSADGKRLIAYPSGRRRASYSVPDGTSSIGTYAFADANMLAELSLPDSLVSFDPDCIAICQDLTRVDYRGNTYSCDEFMSKFAQ